MKFSEQIFRSFSMLFFTIQIGNLLLAQSQMAYVGESIPKSIAFLPPRECKRACGFTGIDQNRCWVRISGKQQCIAQLPMNEEMIDGQKFQAIEMNQKSQCRDLCHTLPDCELWSFFEPKSRAYEGLCHLMAKKGSEEAHDCPYNWTCTTCPRLFSDCI